MWFLEPSSSLVFGLLRVLSRCGFLLYYLPLGACTRVVWLCNHDEQIILMHVLPDYKKIVPVSYTRKTFIFSKWWEIKARTSSFEVRQS